MENSANSLDSHQLEWISAIWLTTWMIPSLLKNNIHHPSTSGPSWTINIATGKPSKNLKNLVQKAFKTMTKRVTCWKRSLFLSETWWLVDWWLKSCEPVEVSSLSQYLQGFDTPQVVVWDFWTINSRGHTSQTRIVKSELLYVKLASIAWFKRNAGFEIFCQNLIEAGFQKPCDSVPRGSLVMTC